MKDAVFPKLICPETLMTIGWEIGMEQAQAGISWDSFKGSRTRLPIIRSALLGMALQLCSCHLSGGQRRRPHTGHVSSVAVIPFSVVFRGCH